MVEFARKCFDLVGQGGRLKWIGLVALALVVTGAEAVGAALIFLLLALISDPATPLQAPVLGDLSRFLPAWSHERVVVIVAVSIALFFVVRSGLIFLQTYLQARIVNNAGAHLATRMLRGYLGVPYAFHLQRNSAELIRNSLQSVQSVITHAIVPVVRLVAESLVIIGLLSVLIAVSPLATALAIGVLGPAVWLLLRTIHPRVKRMGRKAQQAIRESIQSAQQSLQGIRDVKLLGREKHFGSEFARSRRSHASAQTTHAALAELPGALIESCVVGFIVLFFVFTVLRGAEAGDMLSVLGLFAYVGLRVQPSLRKIVGAVNNMKFGTAAVDDVHNDLRQFAEPRPVSEARLPFRHALTVDKVTFRYAQAAVPALLGVSLTINRGEAIGICGPTGGGKSTLVDLIVGLLEPTHGRVLVDGKDIRDDIRGWQNQLGVVSQSIFLLDGTLRENIAFGLREDEVDPERIAETVRLAQLETFIASLPLGLDTRVGERGVRLSGGQRQRVAIARALYHRPSILVFDEGTSALDNQTEAELIEALEQLRGEHTIIMVAHRLSTVRRCDRIFVVEAAEISDTGSFEDLASRHRLFAEYTAT